MTLKPIYKVGLYFFCVLTLVSACRKTEQIPSTAQDYVSISKETAGLYSGFFVIEQHHEFDTLSSPTTPTYYTPWVRLFDKPKNDYAMMSGKNLGSVTVDSQPLTYQPGVNAYVGANRTAFDSTWYHFKLNSGSLPSFYHVHKDSFYTIPPIYIAIIPPQLTYTQQLVIPMPTTTGFDEIVVFVKNPDGTALSPVKRFPAGTAQLILNPRDFMGVPLGVRQIEVIIKRYQVKQLGGKTYRFELNNVITLSKRFI